MSLSEVLALARAGAAEAAWSRLEIAPEGERRGVAALTLKGRLLKDRAAAQTGAARVALLRAAGEAYAEAARAAPATYPLINAATLSLLGGAPARAAQLAAETLALLDSGAHEPDTPYWLGATRAEALLLLDREIEARAALREAIAAAPQAWEDHAVTIRQFRLLLAEQGRPAAWLEACRPPSPIHFAGPIGIADAGRLEAAIAAAIDPVAPGTAIGALAAGFDIVAAELLLRHGAELHVVLPAVPELFVAASVAPARAGWTARFEALLGAAARVDILDLPAGLSAGAAALAEEMALGCAIRSARLLEVDAVLLRLAGNPAATDTAERDGVRRLEVRGATNGAGGRALGPPDRPLALLGCRHADAERLGTATGAPVRIAPAGAFVTLEDLGQAADASLALFAPGDSDAHVALDYVPPCADGTPDSVALEALLAMPSRGYPVATRSAALALEARGAPVRLALAGASAGMSAPVEFFSLWGSAAARPPAPRADAAN